MELIEIPQNELLNYLPYYLIEEALEINPNDLFQSYSSKKVPRKESRINNYLMKKNSNFISASPLQDLTNLCNIEQEVTKEIKKIMQKPSLYGALKNDLMIENIESQIKVQIRGLLKDGDKENKNPRKDFRCFNY